MAEYNSNTKMAHQTKLASYAEMRLPFPRGTEGGVQKTLQRNLRCALEANVCPDQQQRAAHAGKRTMFMKLAERN